MSQKHVAKWPLVTRTQQCNDRGGHGTLKAEALKKRWVEHEPAAKVAVMVMVHVIANVVAWLGSLPAAAGDAIGDEHVNGNLPRRCGDQAQPSMNVPKANKKKEKKENEKKKAK